MTMMVVTVLVVLQLLLLQVVQQTVKIVNLISQTTVLSAVTLHGMSMVLTVQL